MIHITFILLSLVTMYSAVEIEGNAVNSFIVCEAEMYKKLQCVKATQINIISANYGRTNKTECPVDDYYTSTSLPNVMNNDTCFNDISSSPYLLTYCPDNYYCLVYASNDRYGDACEGIYKYTEVTYQCLPFNS